MDASKMSNGIKVGLAVVGAFLLALIGFLVYKVVGFFIAGSLLQAGTAAGFDATITGNITDAVATYSTQVGLLDSPVTIMATLIIVAVIIGIFAWMFFKGKKGSSGGDMGY
jgi:hypothetical protein